MKHVGTIKALITTLLKSDTFHALVIESPPGWGKSTTIDLALQELAVSAVSAGSYATPLHIFNTLCRHPDSVIIFDDCYGVFSDQKSLAILKAATWQSSGHGGGAENSAHQKRRHISWGSTSEKVEQASSEFSGKLILLTNAVSAGKEGEAFLSRCLSYRISIGEEDVKQMIVAAASSCAHFPKPEIARQVARFLLEDSTRADLSKINLRTLKMGYDLATTNPEAWRELFVHLLPRTNSTDDLVSQVFRPGLTVREQEARFIASTGKSRRTFYNEKKRLGLTRSYQHR